MQTVFNFHANVFHKIPFMPRYFCSFRDRNFYVFHYHRIALYYCTTGKRRLKRSSKKLRSLRNQKDKVESHALVHQRTQEYRRLKSDYHDLSYSESFSLSALKACSVINCPGRVALCLYHRLVLPYVRLFLTLDLLQHDFY